MRKIMKKVIVMFLIVLMIISTGINIVDASSKRVFIDAGHGGRDGGASGNGLREKDISLELSKKVNSYLNNNYNVTTKMSRTSDVYLTLNQRTNMANDWKADLFLSIHVNAGGGTGYEDYTHTTTVSTSLDRKVQREINKEVDKVLSDWGQRNRGEKKANFHVLRESNMASVLVEVMFIDTKKDADLLKNKNFKYDIAEALAKGVAKGLSLTSKGSGNQSNNQSKPINNTIKIVSKNGEYEVIADSLNVRSGNGVTYNVLGKLAKGEVIKVDGKTSNNWYRFKFNGVNGYVSGNYLKTYNKSVVSKPIAKKPVVSNSTKTNTPLTKASGKYEVTASSLIVRTGNGISYKRVGGLKKGAVITVNAKRGKWYRFNYKGKNRYVHGNYLKKYTTSKEETSSNKIKVSKASGQYQVTASSLNVRTGNTAKYKRVGSLKKGKKITVNGKTSNGWYRFKYNGKNSYVSGKHLKQYTKPTKKTNIPLVKASGKHEVNSTNLNVRTGNGTKYKKVGSIKKGTVITVNAKRGNWYRFNYKGSNRYVSGKHLKKYTKPTKKTNTPLVKASGKYEVTSTNLNVRTGNGTSYKRVGGLKKGAVITVNAKRGNWYRFKHKGSNRYVSGKYLKRK